MYERIAFNVKVESGSTFTFNARRSCNLCYFVYHQNMHVVTDVKIYATVEIHLQGPCF